MNPEVAAKVAKVKNWRFGYVKYVQKNVRLACESKENALKIAQAGLDKSMELFEFVPSQIQGGGSEPMTLQQAMDKFKGKPEYSFDTYVLKGENLSNKGHYRCHTVANPALHTTITILRR